MALMNYCLARQNAGSFILRIEDTDTRRSNAASERMILEALRWLGLSWDEGPDVGGPHAPYRQSERTAIYRSYTDQLVAARHAFPCFCTPARLDAMRTVQRRLGMRLGYDGHCLALDPNEVRTCLNAGIPHTIRMKVPEQGTCVFHDARRGLIKIDWSAVDMQVLMKSDGQATYHLANVVDDHLMGITHVLRGEEWLSSTPKHILLYNYFNWQMPQFCHMPLLRNPDRSKLSKRHNPTSILYYRRFGYLPETLINLLGLFALSVGDGDDLRRLDEVVAGFNLDHIALGGPVFDIAKLDQLNGRHLRETLNLEQMMERIVDWALNPHYLRPIAELARKRIHRFSDLGPLTAFFFLGKS